MLTGPTTNTAATTPPCWNWVIQHNWNESVYQIIDTQMVWSKAPVFGPAPAPGYNENAYDVYTYLGLHLDRQVGPQQPFEWYDDEDGLGYAGGFGNGQHTTYYEGTIGLDYHPTKWVQFAPKSATITPPTRTSGQTTTRRIS